MFRKAVVMHCECLHVDGSEKAYVPSCKQMRPWRQQHVGKCAAHQSRRPCYSDHGLSDKAKSLKMQSYALYLEKKTGK